MSSSAKATKKSAFSCEPCRRRKVKCGGEQPKCTRCATRSEECIYKLNPTLSYTQRLERRIKELEDQLADAGKSPVTGSISSPQSSSSNAGHTSVDGRLAVLGSKRDRDAEDSAALDSRAAKQAREGSVTSQPPQSAPFPTDDADFKRRQRLTSFAWQQRALEDLSEIPEPFQHLIRIHWTWIQPLFGFIYRPAFTRDMQTMGPYYSHTLLNAILAHSLRWGVADPNIKKLLDESYDGGRVFGKHARTMLFSELSNGAYSITTVQTLLLLSAQELSEGRIAQSWLYTGIAFRLIDYLGIKPDGHVVALDLTDEEIELRRRVFWSGYFWDKAICLYFGAVPSLQETNETPSKIMFEDSNDAEPWAPYGISVEKAAQYPPQPSYMTTCNLATARLAVILNQVLTRMYHPHTPNSDEEIVSCFHSQSPLLLNLWESRPDHLKIHASSCPKICPPAHIAVNNCIYYSVTIIMYRPMILRPLITDEDRRLAHRCLVDCANAGIAASAIFDSYCNTFGIGHLIMPLTYGVYMAAAIFLLQIEADPTDIIAIDRLRYCLRQLEAGRDFSILMVTWIGKIHGRLTSLGIAVEEQQAVPFPGWSAQRPAQAPPVTTNASLQGSLHLDKGVPVSSKVIDVLHTLTPLTVRLGTLN